jgi:diacylglycerol kinase family enzyme/membrane-associated phospholipid phosphatase
VIAAVAVVWIVTASSFVVLRPAVVDDIDVTVGRPLAEFTAREAAVDSTADVVAEIFRPTWVVIALLVVAVVVGLRGFRRTASWLAVVPLGCQLTTIVMKEVFARPRPSFAAVHLEEFSFPSGHATGSACAAGVAMVLATLFVRRGGQRRLVAVLAVCFALLVGADRILLGVHGLVDVLTGYAVAAMWVSGAAWLVDPTPRPPPVAPLPHALPRSRDVAVVLNPIKVEDPAAFRALVDARAVELGWNRPRWFETTVEDTGRSMAHEAAIGGAELVVVCGGDGTVRTVCAELAGTGIPVGVVPAGTGNLLARNLALPLYLNGAVEVALNGQDRAIDLVRITGDGIAEGEHFLVMAGMGFDAAIMEGANEQIKARVGWLAYVVSGFRNLMFPAVRVEVRVDGGAWSRHRVRTVVVGNVGFLQAGLPLLPDAVIDDGRLDAVLVNPRRFRHWLLVVVRVVGRARKLDEIVNRVTGRVIEVRASADTPRQVDGDPIGAGRELRCECLPGKLLVRVAR